MAICSIEGCGQPINCRGWCPTHYGRWKRHGDPNHEPRKTGDHLGRFYSKVNKQPEGCWFWTGSSVSSGYGLFWDGTYRKEWQPKMVLVHRWAYEQLVGPIPAGLHIDHTCHNTDSNCSGGIGCRHRRCVNPAHLEPVTRAENVRRGQSGEYLRNRTHCPKGHPYDEVNTYVRPSGARGCRECSRERDRRRRRANAVRG